MGFDSGQGRYAGTSIGGIVMRKRPIDLDPVEEIRAIRTEMMREYKTLDALCEYIEKNPPLPTAPRKKSIRQSSTRRKTAKRLAHA